MSNEASVFAEYELHRIRKKKKQMIVGDSLLKGTGLQMMSSDSLSMDVCCLLGALDLGCWRDTAKICPALRLLPCYSSMLSIPVILLK